MKWTRNDARDRDRRKGIVVPNPHIARIIDAFLLQLVRATIEYEAASVGFVCENLADRFAIPAKAAGGPNFLGIQFSPRYFPSDTKDVNVRLTVSDFPLRTMNELDTLV